MHSTVSERPPLAKVSPSRLELDARMSELFREALEHFQLTQDEVATCLEVNRAHVSRMANAEEDRHRVGFSHVALLCNSSKRKLRHLGYRLRDRFHALCGGTAPDSYGDNDLLRLRRVEVASGEAKLAVIEALADGVWSADERVTAAAKLRDLAAVCEGAAAHLELEDMKYRQAAG